MCLACIVCGFARVSFSFFVLLVFHLRFSFLLFLQLCCLLLFYYLLVTCCLLLSHHFLLVVYFATCCLLLYCLLLFASLLTISPLLILSLVVSFAPRFVACYFPIPHFIACCLLFHCWLLQCLLCVALMLIVLVLIIATSLPLFLGTNCPPPLPLATILMLIAYHFIVFFGCLNCSWYFHP